MIEIWPYKTNMVDDGSNEILLGDHMPPTYSVSRHETLGWHKNSFIDTLAKAGISTAGKTIYANHYLLFDDFTNLHIIDNMFVNTCSYFYNNQPYTVNFSNPIRYQLSFMSNKSRPHRILCSTVIANLFDNITHTYVAGDSDTYIKNEILKGTNYDFNRNLSLSPKWVDFNDMRGNVLYSIPNREIFMVLYNTLFLGAGTSIITEPCFYELGNMLTEKTLMAIYSCHFMIWPGAWKIADTATKLGLDVFDDYIDHSYQYLEHPGERVVEAFLRNKEFLSNVELQQEARTTCKDRLLNNLHLVRDIPRIFRAVDNLSIRNPV